MEEMSSGLSSYRSKHQVGGHFSPLFPHFSSLSPTDTSAKTHPTNVTRSGDRPCERMLGQLVFLQGVGSKVPPVWIYERGQMVMLR